MTKIFGIEVAIEENRLDPSFGAMLQLGAILCVGLGVGAGVWFVSKHLELTLLFGVAAVVGAGIYIRTASRWRRKG